ncbi:sigma-70 family RNA polymerase sigma factor [Candidatus Bipolaricaulota bacterium]|nr:sigma-70 family RNA polymerase sigma factor [Candidatus Bipolaricaulota bacterium]
MRRGVEVAVTDEQLIQAVASGSRTAFRRLYEQYADRVLRFAQTIVREPHLAEEVLQETMIAVWKDAGRFAGRSKLSTWLLGITRNQAHSLLRREKRGLRTPPLDLETEDPAPNVEQQVALERAFAALSPAQREVLHLTFYDHLTVNEAADVLGIPPGTVKSRMYHARRILAKELQ